MVNEVMKLLEDSKLDKKEKAQKVTAVLTRIGSAEQADLDALKNAQRKFAQEYNLTLQ